jgi:hypothetical protein
MSDSQSNWQAPIISKHFIFTSILRLFELCFSIAKIFAPSFSMILSEHTNSLDQCIHDIKAINAGWKASQTLLGNSSGLSRSLRQLKTRRQIKLLLEVGKPFVSITLDLEADPVDPLFGIKIHDPSSSYCDADHIPERVLREYLSQEQIENLLTNNLSHTKIHQ